MDACSLLIVSSRLDPETLTRPPFGLDPESFLLARLESVKWLGFSRFSAIILHEPPAELLGKLALGLRDGAELEALWELVQNPRGPRVRVLVDEAARSPQPWIDLGLEPILPQELAALSAARPRTGRGPDATQPRGALTADDVRELHQQGVRHLPPDRPLTDWAREVAATLGLTDGPAPAAAILWPIGATTRKELQARSAKIFQAAQAVPELLFVLDPPHIPVFQELFPALRTRTVSPAVHWATHGAFTGEVSVPMLADLGCRGAIVPDLPPHNRPDHLKAILLQAAKAGLRIFPAIPLERLSACDIMAGQSGTPVPSGLLVPLGKWSSRGPGRGSKPEAFLVTDQELEMVIQGKGR